MVTPKDDINSPSDLAEIAHRWAEKIRKALVVVAEAASTGEENTLVSISIDESINDAPRRRSAHPETAALAVMIAGLLYPAPNDSLAPLIKYESDIVTLRKLITQQRKSAIEEATARKRKTNWENRIRKQGPWDEAEDPLSLNGVSSLPMPVKIAAQESLAPFFEHLRVGGTQSQASTTRATKDAIEADEPYYGIQTLEFPKGVVYSDGRMDLCKMVLGPPNIGDLVESLKTNTFIKHFLLGNNIIGPHGAKCIADFLGEFPNRMNTWYLAGNCIDPYSFNLLVNQWIRSSAVTNIWLKRNPLKASAAHDVYRLITETPNLRTLDLDQTELGDLGVEELFSKLAAHPSERPLALRHIYLNACGVGVKAASAIAEYLSNPLCTITSLYLTNNPLGSSGVIALAAGLKENKTLTRLTLASVGMDDRGATALCSALSDHPTLFMLDIGHSYATEDLGMRYNWITDRTAHTICNMVESLGSLQYLNLGYCALHNPGLNGLLKAVCDSPSLLWFNAKTIHPQERSAFAVEAGQEHRRLLKEAHNHLAANVKKLFGANKSYSVFLEDEKRWIINDKDDIRKIDSVYRNRDAGLARRGMKKLEKWWDEDDETLNEVMTVGPTCALRKRHA